MAIAHSDQTDERGTGDRDDALRMLGPRKVPADRASGDDPGAGEGRDRRLRDGGPGWRRIALWGAAALAVILVAVALWNVGGGDRLQVERGDLTVATVRAAPFQELATVTGEVLPRTTIYLDAVAGGRVEEVLVAEGSRVERGQPLLRLSNNDLRLRMLAADTQRIEQRNRLEEMQSRMERNALELRQELAELDYQVERLEKSAARNRELWQEGVVSEQEYRETVDELEYYRRNRELTRERYQQEQDDLERQVAETRNSVRRMRANTSVVEDILDALVVRAPRAGRLTSLEAEFGEWLDPGSRVGQIDVLADGYRVRAGIDEFYLGRVEAGQTALTQPLFGERHRLEVTQVYPQVEDGEFAVDLAFRDGAPEGLRRGQTIRARLELSDAEPALVLPRGPFYRDTGGQWAYVVAGDEAVRRPIRLGRQNPEVFEVVEGLDEGDRVIVSTYEPLGDSDVLVLQ